MRSSPDSPPPHLGTLGLGVSTPRWGELEVGRGKEQGPEIGPDPIGPAHLYACGSARP